MALRTVSLLLVAGIALLSPPALGDDAETRFEREAASAWKRYQSEHRPTRIEFSIVDRAAAEEDGGGLVQTTEILRHSSGEHFLVREQSGTVQTIIGQDGDYAFQARRVSANDDWEVEYLGPTTFVVRGQLEVAGGRWLDMPISVLGVALPDLLDVEGVKIQSIQFVDGPAGRRDVQLEFTCDRAGTMLPGADLPIRSGTVVLAPDREWTVSRFTVDSDEGTLEAEYRYEARSDGQIALERIALTVIPPNGGPPTVVDHEFSGYSRAEVPITEFSPQQIGLPEATALSVVEWKNVQHVLLIALYYLIFG